jgi:N-acetylglucosaminyl-diphospho-decaprenol L-rhamnosyltransferase
VEAPRVAVVVVTYNSAGVLPHCLESLRDGGAEGVELTDVVVVDNASSDTSTEIAKATDGLPISVVQLTENAGYAAGVNAGVTALRNRPPEAVLVLNPDCRVRPRAISTLVEALRAPGRGVVAPRLVNLDGTLQPTLRRLPTVLGAFAEAVLGGRLADRLGVGELVFTDEPHQTSAPAAWVTGAALLLAWALIESVGPWDERFLLYSEETEYMLRASDRGWSTWFEPAAVIEHEGGESGTRPSLAALLTVNKVGLFRRRHGAVRGLAYSGSVLLGALLRSALGQRTARASAAGLLFPSRRISSLAELR